MIAATPAQQQRARERQLAGRRHREEAAEDHDRDLDVELGPHRVLDRIGEAREHVGDHQADDERENIGAFIRQPQRPADAELLQVGRRHRGEVREIADDPARIGDPEHRGEGERESLDVDLERNRRRAQHDEERDIGRNQRAETAERSIGLRHGTERLADVGPHRGGDHPAEQIDVARSRRATARK